MDHQRTREGMADSQGGSWSGGDEDARAGIRRACGKSPRGLGREGEERRRRVGVRGGRQIRLQVCLKLVFV